MVGLLLFKAHITCAFHSYKECTRVGVGVVFKLPHLKNVLVY